MLRRPRILALLYLALLLGLGMGSDRIEAATGPISLLEITPSAESTVEELVEVEVVFDRFVFGVDAADLLVNGLAATGVSQPALGHFVFTFPTPPAGRIEFSWAPDHGISDEAGGGGNAFAGLPWTVTFDATRAWQNVRITEFMADADVALYDDDCDRSDWIEIHNGGLSAVNLLGWALTDDVADRAKWRFPAFVLEPETYLVIFASQKNKTNLPPRACRTKANSVVGFHTNFKLDADGEYLALIAPDGTTITEFAPAYPPQRRDVSYGSAPGSPDQVGYLNRPTPRAANVATGEGFVDEVTFSRSTSTFLEPFSLTLRTPNADAVIRFTLDGTFPAETNANLRTYSEPLLVTNTVQVRARAYAPGLLPSAPASETFLRLTNAPSHLGSFTSTLPVLVITTLKNLTLREGANTPVHFSLYEPRNGATTLRSRPTLVSRGGAKIRGSSSAGLPQSSFAIEWWDEFNQDRDLGPLGLPADSEWVLYAPSEYDPTLIHNAFTMEISREMNFTAPRTRFVEVYLNKGGQIRSNDWNGVYVLMEKPGLSKDRVDAPKAAPEDTAFPEVTGSYLFKTDRLDPGDSGFSAGGAQNVYVEPKEREMKSPQRAPQLAYLGQFFRDLDAALRSTNPDFRHPVRGYRGYLEITNWMDFHLLETLSGQVDAIRLSSYFYKRREGKLEYGPRWDYDRAWESKADGRDDNPRIWDGGGGLFGAPWWNRLLADTDAWQVWIDRWAFHRQSALQLTNLFRIIDAMTNEVRFSQPREVRRWPTTAPRISYANEIRIMKTWISNRVAWLDSQFAPAPRISTGDAVVTPGFQLTLAVPTGISQPANVAIFYTLDGSDPRPSRGTNTPVASRYSGPLSITTNSRVVARLRDTGKAQRSGPRASSTWSAPVAATLVVTPPPLTLTELMFHPEIPEAGSPYAESDFEFLELKNISGQTVDLAGYHFVAGIDFRFAETNAVRALRPGERVLLVSNEAAFRTRYPTAGAIGGQFLGNLADEGERLALAGPVEEPIFDFIYGDDWQGLADGLGFSLVLADESTAPARLGDAGRWRPSSDPDGSPGRNDPAPGPSAPRVFLNEFLASPESGGEWIELYNVENAAADVGGWWLSDTLDHPKKARLPFGTRLAAGEFRKIPESVFHPADGTGFGLSARGDGLWLLSADAEGRLTGWVHGTRFGATRPNESLGRLVTHDGLEHWVATTIPTPGRSNAAPRVGPVVLSEINLGGAPLAGLLGSEQPFLEFCNLSSAIVPLGDPAAPASHWRLRGDLDFDFGERAVTALRPGECLVLVGFDPDLEPFELAGFRARHALDGTTQILGPWRGAINPAALRLELQEPIGVTGESTSDQTYALVESVDALAQAPWSLDGFAPNHSLVRIPAAAFANASESWRSGPPTPGALDEDLDSLPDAWESAYGLSPTSATGADGPDGDPDGDGFTNATEFRNHSSPRDSASGVRLRAEFFASGRITLSYYATPGSAFHLESRSHAESGVWETLQTLTTPATGRGVTEIATPSGSARFYRLRRF